MLERLGDPADIAAEARERYGVQVESARPAIPWLEVLTLASFVLVPFIVLLGMSMLVPFLAWLAGLALLWRSSSGPVATSASAPCSPSAALGRWPWVPS